MKAAKIILINSEGKILLNRRSKNERFYPNCWSSVGGKIDLGESPEQAIIRETKEEINFDLENFKLFKIYKDEFPERHFFIAKIDKQLSELVLGEGDEIDFFTFKEALDLKLSRMSRNYLEDYFSHNFK